MTCAEQWWLAFFCFSFLCLFVFLRVSIGYEHLLLLLLFRNLDRKIILSDVLAQIFTSIFSLPIYLFFSLCAEFHNVVRMRLDFLLVVLVYAFLSPIIIGNKLIEVNEKTNDRWQGLFAFDLSIMLIDCCVRSAENNSQSLEWWLCHKNCIIQARIYVRREKNYTIKATNRKFNVSFIWMEIIKCDLHDL